MPPRFKTQEEQLELCKVSVQRYQEDLNKYLYLIELQVYIVVLIIKKIIIVILQLRILFSSSRVPGVAREFI